MAKQPKVMGQITREALTSWLKTEDVRRAARQIKISEDDDGITSKSQKIGRLLSAIFKAYPGVDTAIYEALAIDYLVLAHHPEIGEGCQTSWIALVQNLGLDPVVVAVDQQERILKALWKAAAAPPTVSSV